MKRYIQSRSQKSAQRYVFNFGDGNSARSRGTEQDNDVELEALLSSDVVALIAGTYMTDIYSYIDEEDTFTDEDVFEVLSESYGWDKADWDKAIKENKIEEWKNSIASADISGGDILMYKISRGSKVLYYDKYVEEEVKSYYYDEE